MKPTGNDQINTKVYWDYIYTTNAKKLEYWTDNNRFSTLLNHVKDGDKFIDLGCGLGIPGRMVREKRKNCEIWGVDISGEVIRNNLKDDPNVKYYQGYIGNLGFLPKNYFDVVFIGEVIEHLDDPKGAFLEAYQLLKDGGRLVVTTPNNHSVDSPEHIWEFSKDDMELFFKETGFKEPEFKELPDLEYLLVFFAVGIK